MKRILQISIALLINIYAIFAQTETHKTALLIIDIQEFYFPGDFSELVNPEKASLNAQKLFVEFRKKNKHVIHIKHNVDKQGEIHNNVKPIEGEKIICKDEVNCFKDTDLKNYIDNKNITQLVICGMLCYKKP